MKLQCPNCCPLSKVSDSHSDLVRAGRFKRRSDGKSVQRWKCKRCEKNFSQATFHPCYWQKKRHLNHRIHQELASGVSQRRIALNLRISRLTVKRKFMFLSHQASLDLISHNKALPQALIVEFDDLESFEHTKCKPLSVTLMVEHKTRRILGFATSRMPAKGKLAVIARKKYGPRRDERASARDQLFAKIKPLIHPKAVIKSDENPHYSLPVKKHFPLATHERFKGQRGSIVGQWELKKVRFDPLFSLNHTCAMLRANINRLIRKTWSTTKVPENLQRHLAIYAIYHNKVLLEPH